MQQETPQLEISDVKEFPETKTIKVALNGRLFSHLEMKDLDDFFMKFRNKEFINFIFDFDEVRFISSTGLSKFAQFIKDTEKEGGKIIICAPQENILHVLETVSLHRRLHVCDSLDEALKKV